MATFSPADCGPCPARSLCTTGKRRQLTLTPRDILTARTVAVLAELVEDQILVQLERVALDDGNGARP